MNKTWKYIVGYEGIYQVSNTGDVRRRFNPKYKSRVDVELKKSSEKTGYLSVLLSVDGYKKRFLVHRLVALSFIENPKNKKVVNHIDFNKENNSVNNLEWCTQSENCKHSISMVRMPNNKGSNHGMSKLNEEDVLSIRGSNMSTKELSKKYNISLNYVYDIKNKKRWKHI